MAPTSTILMVGNGGRMSAIERGRGGGAGSAMIRDTTSLENALDAAAPANAVVPGCLHGGVERSGILQQRGEHARGALVGENVFLAGDDPGHNASGNRR